MMAEVKSIEGWLVERHTNKKKNEGRDPVWALCGISILNLSIRVFRVWIYGIWVWCSFLSVFKLRLELVALLVNFHPNN